MWDRTVDVLQHRAGTLAGLGALYVFVPGVISAALTSYSGENGGLAATAMLFSLAVAVLLVLGMLAITAAAIDPAIGHAQAATIARQRLGFTLVVLLVVVVVATIVFTPGVFAMVASGVTVDAAGRPNADGAAPGLLLVSAALMLAAMLLGLWVTAKLAPLLPVIVAERRGWGAFARSFALTRGAALRLVGVILLYSIVLGVVLLAATSVVGVVARLLLGEDAAATVGFVVAIASAAVTAVATVVQSVFYAQYYVAARDAKASV